MQSQDQAEAIALQALEFLVGDEELCAIFLGSSGASIDDMRKGAADPVFLGSVLDFILMDDSWIKRFCDRYDLAYTAVLPARHALPGGAPVHWT